jgi:hypothetical protein
MFRDLNLKCYENKKKFKVFYSSFFELSKHLITDKTLDKKTIYYLLMFSVLMNNSKPFAATFDLTLNVFNMS